MYEFYIYNAARERIGILQHDDSVQWLEHYQTPGEVKIVARATPDNLALLVEGNRIYNTDSDTAARISNIEQSETDAEETITLHADITAELLSDRVVMATENITNVEAGMYSVYSKNRRALPIEIAAAKGYRAATETEISWLSVLEAEQKLAEISGLGFKVVFDPVSGVETLVVYSGVDRSKETSPDYVGYFGTDVDNIQNVQVISGSTNYKNVAIIEGADVDEEGVTKTVIRTVSLGTVTGENRRELYVDAKDITRDYQKAIDTGDVDDDGNPIFEYEDETYTDAEFYALLDARGREELEQYLKDFSITCDIEQNNILFGIDYQLGDRMPIKLTERGISATAIIASVNHVYEKEGTRVVALLNQFALEAS